MKPLYLNGGVPIAVDLNGPALRVSRANAAVQRFPLRRISRVIASGNTSWSTRALLACADRGVAVCFLNADGSTRARWIGRADDRDGFLQRWQDFQDRPDWQDLYRQWCVATRRRAVRMCAWRMGWSPGNDPRSMIRVILRATDSVTEAGMLTGTHRLLRGLAQARVIEELAKLGLTEKYASLSCLIPILTTVVVWGLRPDTIRWLQDCAGRNDRHGRNGTPETRAVVSFLERHSPTTEFVLRDSLNRLRRFIWEQQ